MCGIAGLINKRYVSESQLTTFGHTMANKLIHRGPDSSGVWTDANNGLVLSHRRLAIQDLSPHGAQPMHSHTNRFAIVFNGEIYNFLEIAKMLTRDGVRFQGHSDTEVLITAIEHWGLNKALDLSEGMFAFALWDKTERTLILARDRLGEKPLYYGLVNGGFCFASELKAVRCLPGFANEIDRSALTLYMKYGYVPAPYSIYENMYKLMPGTYIEITQKLVDKITENRESDKALFSSASTTYWSINEAYRAGKNQIISDPLEAELQLESLLHETIRRQMISDVPLGAFLSGGIDSSIVTAIAQSESSAPINTFTIGYHEADYNEADFAKKIAKHLGTNHTELYITAKDGLEVVPRLPEIYDEPFADVSQIPMYLVTALAKQHVTVVLSGDGGDELFAGYNRYYATQRTWNITQRLPRSIRTVASKFLLSIPPGLFESAYSSFVKLGALKNQANFGGKVHKLAAIMESESIYDAYQYLISFWHNADELVIQNNTGIPEINSLGIDSENPNFIEYAMLLDQHGYLPDDNLIKGDRASMANSLEMRLPLLSHKVLEYSWRLPLDMKLCGGTTKKILRDSLYKYVPRELIERPKMGFSVPLDSWLKGPLRDWAEDLLSPNRLANEGYFNPEIVSQTWRDHITNKHNNQLQIWSVLMFQSWLAATK